MSDNHSARVDNSDVDEFKPQQKVKQGKGEGEREREIARAGKGKRADKGYGGRFALRSATAAFPLDSSGLA